MFPLPAPFIVAVYIVIQFAPLVAVHGRSGVAITETMPFAPFTLAVELAGLTENDSSPVGLPCCVTVNVSVPIVTVPVRDL